MARPKGVQQQVDAANRLIEQIKQGGNPQSAQPPIDPGAATPIASPTNVSTPSTIALAPEDPNAPPVAASSTTETPPALTLVENESAQKPEDWEHKYKVLTGKYNAEVPRLTRQVTELIDRSANLERVLAEFSNHNAPAGVPTTPAAPVASSITPEERAEWGGELIDLIGRRAQEMFGPLTQSLETRLKALEGGVSTVAAKVGKVDQDRVYAKLDTEVPGWDKVNTSEEFLTWLNGFDSYSGVQRAKMLTQAFASNDGERVVSFFKGFLKEYATVTPTLPTSVTQNGNGTPAVDLRSLAAPGRPAPGVNPADGAQPQKRVWSHGQIAAFYNDCRKGVFKGRDEERVSLERDIIAATAEGRVQN